MDTDNLLTAVAVAGVVYILYRGVSVAGVPVIGFTPEPSPNQPYSGFDVSDWFFAPWSAFTGGIRL